ncbi:ATP-binding protein [Pedobacter frigidisoli]|uniref:ATP-binding protein n=1 Tax=Pedobacter frigidisoli TaxID=2530455 RepID=A0A4R0P534_9SPHI|nr:ATP-binding protein [Pedobacter frigidisoli]TCD10399.1 ATP-binding protein [Pedobacter frigidisoli]
MEQIFNTSKLVNTELQANANAIQAELAWFEEVLQLRSAINFGNVPSGTSIFDAEPPDLNASTSKYGSFVSAHNFNFEERLLLFLAMVSQVKPQCLDIFLVQNAATGQIFTEFGGRKGNVFSGFLPTAETFLFIIAADNLSLRFDLLKLFDAKHPLFALDVMEYEPLPPGEPISSIPLHINKNWFEEFTTGKRSRPRFSTEFPAQLIETQMEFNELVLPHQTMDQLDLIATWLQHNDTMMNDFGLKTKLKPGFRSLFFGQPGTGKSLAAALLGKRHGFPVYRIDLSRIVSKYIGETGKNLSKVFDAAENQQWILFFDEADALFGKRTNVSDARDRYANQETSYLLQRIEDHNGLVILASNFKQNIDQAFLRRFQSIIEFPIPEAEQRLKLWQQSFSAITKLEPKVNLVEIATKYELSGGVIINVVRYATLKMMKDGVSQIRQKDIFDGIKAELKKSGRTM